MHWQSARSTEWLGSWEEQKWAAEVHVENVAEPHNFSLEKVLFLDISDEMSCYVMPENEHFYCTTLNILWAKGI